MENTGIIKYILSRKKGQDFLAACLFTIVFQWGVIIHIYRANVDLNKESKEAELKAQQKQIDFLTKQNADYLEMKKQVDSAKAALEIFKIKQEMK